MRQTLLTSRWIRIFGLIALLAAPALGQEAPPDAERRALAAKYAQQSMDAFGRGDYAQAEEALLKQLTIEPDNFVVLYNLACCRALQGDLPGAEERLVQAIDHGFTDLGQLKRDPHLSPLRARPTYTALVGSWTDLLAARAEANLELNRKIFAKGYREWRDPKLRLTYLSAFDARSDDTVTAELSRLAAWGDTNVFGDLLDPEKSEADAWVLIIMPSQPDFARWVSAVYGPGAVNGMSMIAGSYEHDKKRLVSMDLGSTLRHEFFHVLHWRSATRLGQAHPIWIMEGLCSLVEDCDTSPDGQLVPVPSWRTNTVQRMARIGNLMPIEDLASMSQLKFVGPRRLANYATARAVFLYLWERGKLKTWYTDYTANFAEDATGVRALERTIGMPIGEINKDFRGWIRDLPSVPEEIKPGMASLGVEVEAGAGDGPVIVGVPRRTGLKTTLKVGDVITGIDGRPVRELAELVRVLGGYEPGAEVDVSYRRYKVHASTRVKLVRK